MAYIGEEWQETEKKRNTLKRDVHLAVNCTFPSTSRIYILAGFRPFEADVILILLQGLILAGKNAIEEK